MDSPLTIIWPVSPSETIPMPLRAVGVMAGLKIDNRNRVVGLTGGAIHGVETAGALSALLVPAVARVLTAAINAAPSGDWRKDLIAWMEPPKSETSMRKCTVLADCCAHSPATCKILPTEVTNSFLGGVLAPDVEVFDSEGNWRPVPAGKNKNGYSVGLGFEAVPATF